MDIDKHRLELKIRDLEDKLRREKENTMIQSAN
jgi:hypothetical protein